MLMSTPRGLAAKDERVMVAQPQVRRPSELLHAGASRAPARRQTVLIVTGSS
jgi:hypothetical protein